MFDREAFREVIEDYARRKGIWAELWGKIEEGLSVERRDRRLEAVEAYRETLFAVRVIYQGRAGLSYTTQASEEAIREAAEQAYEIARFSEEEAEIPEVRELPKVTPRSLIRRSPEELESFLLEAENSVFSLDPRLHRIEKTTLSFSETTYFIFQSRGLSAGFRTGAYSFFISLTAREGEEERAAWEWREAPDLQELELRRLARRAAVRALDLLSARKISSRKLPILFPPQVAVALLETLSSSFCGDEVLKGRSRLAGKLGQPLFSPTITLVDHGLLPGGAETRPFDDEGMPQTRKILVSEGTISAFLYDTLCGRRAGKASTGNARRPSFRSLPTVSATNFYVEPGNFPPEALREAEQAVFEVYEILGWHTTDPVSGDFSVGVSGVLHKGGRKIPVAGMALSGNLFDLWARVTAVGKDLTFYGKIGSPSLLVSGLDLSGA